MQGLLPQGKLAVELGGHSTDKDIKGKIKTFLKKGNRNKQTKKPTIQVDNLPFVNSGRTGKLKTSKVYKKTLFGTLNISGISF